MDNGKAAGLDDLTSENLKFSHLIVVSLLIKLFNSFIINGHIPESFGESLRCPFLNVKVACTRYRMMTSEVSQLAVLFINCLRWLS